MDKQRLSYLFGQYQTDQLSEGEEVEWLEVLTDHGQEEAIHELASDIFLWEDLLAYQMEDKKAKDVLTYVLSQPRQQESKHFVLWKRIGTAAASILVLLSIGIWWYTSHYIGESSLAKDLFANDVNPGKKSAVLLLSNGKKIVLSDAINGELAKETGVVITKSTDGQLIYEVKSSLHGNMAKESYNTLSTGRGETYQVKLPDGSLVWLNASSSLKYPASFMSLKERRVELIGEAYFVVKHDAKQPFRVHTNNQIVEDIGTEFNINAYADESATRTTLIEGSAKVLPLQSLSSGVTLTPNQQSILHGETLQVTTISPEYVTAWKNGYFMFNNENLEQIMIRIARWYKIDVKYQDAAVKEEIFFGTISRFEKISKVLNMLQRTNVVRFQIEGNTVIVSKNYN